MVLIFNLLWRTALAKNAQTSTSFGVLSSNLVCGLVNSVELDSSCPLTHEVPFEGEQQIYRRLQVLKERTRLK